MDKITKIALMYLDPNENTYTIGTKLGISATTVANLLKKVTNVKLKNEIEEKKKMKCRVKSLKEVKQNKNIWEHLPQSPVTRNQLIEWYINNGGTDCLSVTTLIARVKSMGVVVK